MEVPHLKIYHRQARDMLVATSEEEMLKPRPEAHGRIRK
jgi:hypothetical protein